MKIIIVKGKYITTSTDMDLFEGNLDEFIQYIVDNFSNWVLGNKDSCEYLAKQIVERFTKLDNKTYNVYIPEIAAYFKLID